MSSCGGYGTQDLDTGNQITARNIAFDDELIQSGCASVQCVLDNLTITTTEHAADMGNPHEVNIDQIPHILDNHTDVDTGAALNGQVLTYDGTLWHPTNPVTGVTDHLLLTNIGVNDHNQIDAHIGATNNPHVVTAAQAGAEPENANIQAHIATLAGNPHQVDYSEVLNTPPVLNTGFKNVLINGDFRINQRGVDISNDWAGVADGDYGADRWFASTGGVNIRQIVEKENVVQGEPYTLSWEGGGNGQYASIGFGPSPVVGSMVIDDLDFNVTVPKTATNIQLERGTVATPFEVRNIQQELAMCQRFYWAPIYTWHVYAGTTTNVGNVSINLIYPTEMRAPPGITLTDEIGINVEIEAAAGAALIRGSTGAAGDNIRYQFADLVLNAEL